MLCSLSTGSFAPETGTNDSGLHRNHRHHAAGLHDSMPKVEFQHAGRNSGQPECDRKLLIWAHHKTGTVMGRSAVRALNTALDELCTNASWSQVGFECEPRSEDRLRKMIRPQQGNVDNVRTGGDLCVLHLTRNPLEVIVSGYLYHQRADEKWVTKPMDQLSPQAILKEPQWTRLFLKGVAAVHRAAVGSAALDNSTATFPFPLGALAAPLPSESYEEYLLRIPARQGVLAEFVAANETRLPFQLAMHRVLASPQNTVGGQSSSSNNIRGKGYGNTSLHNKAAAAAAAACSAQACLPAFGGSSDGADGEAECERTWQRTLREVGYPHAWLPALASAAGAASCPSSPLAARKAKGHSSAASAGPRTGGGGGGSDRDIASSKRKTRKHNVIGSGTFSAPLSSSSTGSGNREDQWRKLSSEGTYGAPPVQAPLPLQKPARKKRGKVVSSDSPPPLLSGQRKAQPPKQRQALPPRPRQDPRALMALLTELDRSLLGGALARMASVVNCPHTPSYDFNG